MTILVLHLDIVFKTFQLLSKKWVDIWIWDTTNAAKFNNKLISFNNIFLLLLRMLAGKYKRRITKPFSTHEKAQHWHPTLNGDVTLENITCGTHKKCWFKCHKCNHDFEQAIQVVTRGSWCSYCCIPRKKICDDANCENCFNASFASHEKAEYWHPTKNNNIKPRNIMKGTHKKYWFKCPDCNHDINKKIEDIIIKGTWCYYCCKPQQKLCDDDNCEHCFNASFASHEKAEYWHPTKNNNIKPRNIMKGTHKKYWFKCPDCQHSFESNISNIVGHNQWCPYCCKPQQKLCDDDNCEHCFNASFASHEKAKYWHPTKNNKKPRDIMKVSGKKYWFKCSDCNHDISKQIYTITNQGTWCPYCCIPKKQICDNDNCEDCFNASFASHEKAKCWHPTKNGNIKPRNIIKGTQKKYWFICKICKKDLKMSLDSISSKNAWCTCKKNKTEQKVEEWLEKNENILFIKKIKRTYSPKWANRRETHGTGQYRYDIYIELINGVKIIIEIDGPQHYKKINYFKGSHCVIHTQIKDEIKQRLSGKNEHNLIRVNQEDIWQDKNNWEDDIIGFINKKYENNDVITIYYCSGGERYYQN